MSLAHGFIEEPRVELLNGEIVTVLRPNVNHEMVVSNIQSALRDYFDKAPSKCRVIRESEVLLSNDDRPVPELSVVCEPDKIKLRGIFGAPSLVIEVTSPTNSYYDRNYKKDLYEQHGIFMK